MNTTIYNPANKRKEQLIKEFVVRTEEFETILNGIKENLTNGVNHHFLIIGQRGSGKTTLIHRVKYAIEESQSLKQLIPITLGEEQYGISELVNLWEKIAEVLEDYHGFKNLCNTILDEINTSGNQSKVFEDIYDRIHTQGQIIVLFVDNFMDLLDKFSNEEIEYLNKILSTRTNIRIIAASPISPENLTASHESLFKLFKKVYLKGLNNEEIKRLLLKLSEADNSKAKIEEIIQNNPERIEILRLLTGGVTRTIVSLYKIFIDNVGGKSIRDLQLTLDAVTPLYKHNMDDLPKNQQKIVDVIAKSWDATSVKEISKSTRIESKIVSAQISQLEKKQIIEKIPTDKKNHLYQIKERFFNIWYLMRYGRKFDRKRVIWLVRFLESWCSKEELENRITSHITYLESGQYDEEAASLLGEAYLACRSITVDLKKELLNSSRRYLPENLTEGMSISDSDLFRTAYDYYKNQQHEMAIKYALDIENEKIYEFLADNYLRVEDYKNALKYSDLSIKHNNPEIVDYALRGAIYHGLDKFEESIKSFNIALDKGNDYVYTELGIVYRKNEELDQAEKTFLKGIQTEVCKRSSAHQLGHLYEFLNKKAEAIKFFKKAISFGSDKATLCLAKFYDRNDDYENAEHYYKIAIDKYPDKAHIGLSLMSFEKQEKEKGLIYLNKAAESQNAEIQYYIGRTFYRYTDNVEKAIEHFNKSIELGNMDAYHRLAHVYEETGDFDNAEKSFLAAYELNKEYGALICLAELYLENNKHKTEALKYIQEAEEHVDFDHSDYTLLATTLLWNNELEKSLEIMEPILQEFSDEIKEISDNSEIDDKIDEVEVDSEDSDWGFIIDYFIELVSYGQYHIAYDLLLKYDLSDALKPIYFALMNFMKKEFPSEYLKMGDEVKEIVEDILKDIDEKQQNRKK